MRIIEGPSDMFKPGMSYWLALVHNVVDSDMFWESFGAFATQNEKGFAPILPDGVMTKTKLEIKYAGWSDFREKALKLVPSNWANKVDSFPSSLADVAIRWQARACRWLVSSVNCSDNQTKMMFVTGKGDTSRL